MDPAQRNPASDLIRALSLMGVSQGPLTKAVEGLAHIVMNPSDPIILKKQARAACDTLLVQLPVVAHTYSTVDSVEFLLGYKPLDMAALPTDSPERSQDWHHLLGTLYDWMTEERRFEAAVETGTEERVTLVREAISKWLQDLQSLLVPPLTYWRSRQGTAART